MRVVVVPKQNSSCACKHTHIHTRPKKYTQAHTQAHIQIKAIGSFLDELCVHTHTYIRVSIAITPTRTCTHINSYTRLHLYSANQSNNSTQGKRKEAKKERNTFQTQSLFTWQHARTATGGNPREMKNISKLAKNTRAKSNTWNVSKNT